MTCIYRSYKNRSSNLPPGASHTQMPTMGSLRPSSPAVVTAGKSLQAPQNRPLRPRLGEVRCQGGWPHPAHAAHHVRRKAEQQLHSPTPSNLRLTPGWGGGPVTCTARPHFELNLSLLAIPAMGASLVAQWIGICLPTQGTWVPSLIQEDPLCCGAAKPGSPDYEACALEPKGPATEAEHPEARAPQPEKPPQGEAYPAKSSLHLLHLEKACVQRPRPTATGNKQSRRQTPAIPAESAEH